MGMQQALVQKNVSTVEEAYLADIGNSTTNSIKNTMADVLNHLQENYRQLMPHKLLKRKYIVKWTTYHTQDPIATVFSAIK